ncbi:MAG: NAD(P)H-dependent oxidoreductase, partial [bacterium]|nr:NAD(P)H-dependent oxidoreductase [bacterium]
FTHEMFEEVKRGLEAAGHSYVVSDLYEMDFATDLSEEEYLREGYYRDDLPIPEDVAAEQQKINQADDIIFIYPVFWTEAPAKLCGWFQRVWTYGFAYGYEKTMKKLEKAVFLVTMGGSMLDEVRQEQIKAMKCVMLGDRMHDRAEKTEYYVFDEMTRGYGNDKRRANHSIKYRKEAYQIALTI